MFRLFTLSLLAAGMVLGLTSLPGASLKGDAPLPKDLEKLQGSWELVYRLFDGKELPAPKEKTTLSLQGEKFTIRIGEVVTEKGVLKEFDPDASQKKFEYGPTEVNGKPHTTSFPGIYLLQDDLFIACVGYAGSQPTKFSAEANSLCELVIYKRVKK